MPKKTQLPSFTSTQVHRATYLILPSEPAKPYLPGLDFAGWELCKTDYRIDRKTFHKSALEFVAGGRWSLTTPTGEWELTPGSIFTYGPDTEYTLQAKTEKGLSKFFVDFQLPENCPQVELVEDLARQPKSILEHRWLRDLFDQLLDIRRFPAGGRRRIASMTLQLMLARLEKELRQQQVRSEAWYTYTRCKAYLDEHYIGAKSIHEVARNCGVAPAYLSRLFSRFDTETPKAYLTRLKLNHAAKLMLRNNCPLKVAALEVGFGDVFHFSRAFKKCFGSSPTHFIKQTIRS
jgi:AraC-like DNA-binding protein